MSEIPKWIRGAFDSDSPPKKNIALRMAYDEIELLTERNARLVAALERIRDHDPSKDGLYYDSHLQIIESMIATAREALQQYTEKP